MRNKMDQGKGMDSKIHRLTLFPENLMKETCPHCGKDHDVPIKKILEWLGNSEKLRKSVQTFLMKLARSKASPESQRRNVDYSAMQKKSVESRRKNKERENDEH